MSSPSLTGKILNGKWRLGDLVGKGAFADVYEVTDVSAGGVAGAGKFVAKIVPSPGGLPPRGNRRLTAEEKSGDMLYYEHTLYQGYLRPLRDLGYVVEIPFKGYSEDQQLKYLVMTRLGPDIQVAKEENEPWSVARTAGYAQQMLQLLRSLHEKCRMVFVDVKPENFLFGLPGSVDEDKIFLVDFGISAKYTSFGGSLKPQIQGDVSGTPEFLSLKCHDGFNAGRCDDLESLGYVIVSLLKEGDSKLPWSDSTSIEDGLEKKRNTSLETLCQNCPAGMLKFMEAVRGMSFEQVPDYDNLDAILQSMKNETGDDGTDDGNEANAEGRRSAPAEPSGPPAKLRRSSRIAAHQSKAGRP